MKYKLLEVVALTHALPDEGLCAGEFGTIVDLYEPDHVTVEFYDPDKDNVPLPTLSLSEIRKLTAAEHKTLAERAGARSA